MEETPKLNVQKSLEFLFIQFKTRFSYEKDTTLKAVWSIDSQESILRDVLLQTNHRIEAHLVNVQ